MPHEPTDEREETSPRDSSLFYSNGNPAPSYAGQRSAKVGGAGEEGGGRFHVHGGPVGNLREPSLSYGRRPNPVRLKRQT